MADEAEMYSPRMMVTGANTNANAGHDDDDGGHTPRASTWAFMVFAQIRLDGFDAQHWENVVKEAFTFGLAQDFGLRRGAFTFDKAVDDAKVVSRLAGSGNNRNGGSSNASGFSTASSSSTSSSVNNGSLKEGLLGATSSMQASGGMKQDGVMVKFHVKVPDRERAEAVVKRLEAVDHLMQKLRSLSDDPNVQQSLAALNGMQVLKLRVLNHNNKEVMLKKTAWFGRSLLLGTWGMLVLVCSVLSKVLVMWAFLYFQRMWWDHAPGRPHVSDFKTDSTLLGADVLLADDGDSITFPKQMCSTSEVCYQCGGAKETNSSQSLNSAFLAIAFILIYPHLFLCLRDAYFYFRREASIVEEVKEKGVAGPHSSAELPESLQMRERRARLLEQELNRAVKRKPTKNVASKSIVLRSVAEGVGIALMGLQVFPFLSPLQFIGGSCALCMCPMMVKLYEELQDVVHGRSYLAYSAPVTVIQIIAFCLCFYGDSAMHSGSYGFNLPGQDTKTVKDGGSPSSLTNNPGLATWDAWRPGILMPICLALLSLDHARNFTAMRWLHRDDALEAKYRYGVSMVRNGVKLVVIIAIALLLFFVEVSPKSAGHWDKTTGKYELKYTATDFSNAMESAFTSPLIYNCTDIDTQTKKVDDKSSHCRWQKNSAPVADQCANSTSLLFLYQMIATILMFYIIDVACSLRIQRWTFYIPVAWLTVPVTAVFVRWPALFMYTGYLFNLPAVAPITTADGFRQGLWWTETAKGPEPYEEKAAVWIGATVLWMCMVYVTRHVYEEGNAVPTEAGRWSKPSMVSMYNDANMLMNSKRQVKSGKSEQTLVASNSTCVFVCLTMWHEEKYEMYQVLNSCGKLDLAQRPSSLFYEVHCVIDNAFLDGRNKPVKHGNQWVSQIFEVMEEIGMIELGAGKVHLYNRLYGRCIEATLTNGTRFFLHMKDGKKVQRGKRWSQIVYMYLLNDRRTEHAAERGGSKTDYFIFTLDGDIKFEPEGMRYLLQTMKKENQAAVCGRIFPLSPPDAQAMIVYYQEFEYAIGHWFQKTCEHTIGSVLCCPGCFSLFRFGEVWEVLDMYSLRAEKAESYLKYEQGEDRYLSCVLLANGKSARYCALAEAWTFCPGSFGEFFNQRRRWMTSTLINIMHVVNTQETSRLLNEDVSTLFIIYTVVILVGTVISPGMIVLVMYGGLYVAIGPPGAGSGEVNDANAKAGVMGRKSFVAAINILIPCFYCYYCVWCKTIREKDKDGNYKTFPWYQFYKFRPKSGEGGDWQIEMAAILTFVYCLIVICVTVGLLVSLIADPSAPSAVFLSIMSFTFIAAGIMHPAEPFLLFRFVVYILSIPSAYLILFIFAFVNMDVMGWGTREGGGKDEDPEDIKEIDPEDTMPKFLQDQAKIEAKMQSNKDRIKAMSRLYDRDLGKGQKEQIGYCLMTGKPDYNANNFVSRAQLMYWAGTLATKAKYLQEVEDAKSKAKEHIQALKSERANAHGKILLKSDEDTGLLSFEMDRESEKQFAYIRKLEKDAVGVQNFDEAARLKDCEDWLHDVVTEISALEGQKKRAIAKRDYSMARKVKDKIDALRAGQASILLTDLDGNAIAGLSKEEGAGDQGLGSASTTVVAPSFHLKDMEGIPHPRQELDDNVHSELERGITKVVKVKKTDEQRKHAELQADLIEYRESMTAAFFMINVMFVLMMIILSVNGGVALHTCKVATDESILGFEIRNASEAEDCNCMPRNGPAYLTPGSTTPDYKYCQKWLGADDGISNNAKVVDADKKGRMQTFNDPKYKVVNVDPVGIMLLGTFIVIIGLQFLTLIKHRFATLLLHLANQGSSVNAGLPHTYMPESNRIGDRWSQVDMILMHEHPICYREDVNPGSRSASLFRSICVSLGRDHLEHDVIFQWIEELPAGPLQARLLDFIDWDAGKKSKRSASSKAPAVKIGIYKPLQGVAIREPTVPLIYAEEIMDHNLDELRRREGIWPGKGELRSFANVLGRKRNGWIARGILVLSSQSPEGELCEPGPEDNVDDEHLMTQPKSEDKVVRIAFDAGAQFNAILPDKPLHPHMPVLEAYKQGQNVGFWKKRYFVVRKASMSYYAEMHITNTRPLQTILLRDLVVELPLDGESAQWSMDPPPHHSVIILRPDSGFGRSYFLAVKTEEREVWIDNFEHTKATVNIMDSDEQDLDGFEDYGQYDQYDQYD